MNENEPSPGRPLADERAELLSRPEATPPQRILVVDDDAAMRRLNSEALLCQGYVVDTADDGASAWDALQLNRYDLLLTDNGMPKVTGIELLAKVHEAGLKLPAIMATGTAPEEELSRSPWLQPAVMLLKPYSFDELMTAVRHVLHEIADATGNVPPLRWLSEPSVHALRA